MAEVGSKQDDVRVEGNGGGIHVENPQWPPFPVNGLGSEKFPPFLNPASLEKELPSLHAPAAMPLVRDRWERLVTSINVAASPEAIWRALTDASALRQWLAACRGSLEQTGRDCVLDFEDGEFFLCRSIAVDAPHRLQYVWRWLGIGQATSVTWSIDPTDDASTRVTVIEEAINPPWDWQTWNGGGWPGILDQLAAYLRTGGEWRWPWRRMGPYAQIEIPVPIYQAWDSLFGPHSLKYWLLAAEGVMAPGQSLSIFMGDASGQIEMSVHEVVQPGQSPPSFLPHVGFSLTRPVWNNRVGGRLWIEPAGWGRSLLQVFHYNWENLPPGLQLSERRLVTNFWSGAMLRARQLCGSPQVPAAPHNW
jgi:uncharacterized protein YndB with AHSA1/START domain